MASSIAPFDFGAKSAFGPASDLGAVYFIGPAAYRLVQATAALLLTANGKFVDETSSTTLTYKSAALSAVTSTKPLGLVSSAQVSLNSGDFFLVQVQGVGTVTGANTVTVGLGVTTAAAGLVANVTATFAAAVPATIVGTALATAAGATATISLKNLI